MSRHVDPVLRFWSYVDVQGEEECWPWLASCVASGAGQFNLGGRMVPANRHMWELERGPIPKGMKVLLTCGTRNCCNPKHMQLSAHSGGRCVVPLKDRFWKHVGIRSEGECWPWLLSKHPGSKYGQVGGPNQTVLRSHRVAWELTYGAIPEGQSVLHRCDNPICCNPAHLFLGTQDDNMKDMARKGRGHKRPSRAWLTPDQVIEIRDRLQAGATQAALAREYGVSEPTIWAIKHRRTWATLEKI